MTQIELTGFVVDVTRDAQEVTSDPVLAMLMFGASWGDVLDAFPDGAPEPRRTLIPGPIEWEAYGQWTGGDPLAIDVADFVFVDHGLRGRGVVVEARQLPDGASRWEIRIRGIGALEIGEMT